jgi:glycosyltransferase involved in cell wall biosynthesis
LKVTFVIASLKIGGTENRFLSLIKGLQKNKSFQINIILFSSDIEFNEINSLGYEIFILDRKTLSIFKLFLEYYRLIKKLKPNVIHVWDSYTAFYTAVIKPFLPFKLISSQIASAPEEISKLSIIWILSRITFFSSDLIIANSYAGLKAYSAPPSKSIHIYNGFNFTKQKDIASKQIVKEKFGLSTEFIVGMVANFTIYKDQPTFIQAAKSVLKKRNDVTFLFVGDGPCLLDCKNMISDNEVNNIRFLGKQKDVLSIINCIDVGVLTTYNEGISNSIIEYMASGKPVVATMNEGTKELVIDRVTGYLINKQNPDILKEKIEQLLEDSELREKMGDEGRNRIRQYFNLNEMIDMFIKHYHRIG